MFFGSLTNRSSISLQQTELHFLSSFRIVWAIAIDDVHLEKMKSSEIKELTEDFMNAFESPGKSLKEEHKEKFCIYLQIIRKIYDDLESTMTEKQQIRFKRYIREYMEATAEEAELFREGNGGGKDSFGKFIEVRLKTVFAEFYQLMSEVVFSVGDYDDPLIE